MYDGDPPRRDVAGDDRRTEVPPVQQFPPELASIRAARKFVADALRGVPVEIDEALLLVSEIATNAVVHAQTWFTVKVRTSPLPVHVDVQDGSSEPPVRHHPGPRDSTGRGLLLLDQLAADWGVAPCVGGKRVWFECADSNSLRTDQA